MQKYQVQVIAVLASTSTVEARTASDAVSRARGEHPGAVVVVVDGAPAWVEPEAPAKLLSAMGYEREAPPLDAVDALRRHGFSPPPTGDGAAPAPLDAVSSLGSSGALGAADPVSDLRWLGWHREADTLEKALSAPSPSASLPE